MFKPFSTFLLRIVKPRSGWATILIFVTLLGMVVASMSPQLAHLRETLSSPTLTAQIGSLEVSAFTALRAVLILALVVWSTAIVSDLIESRIRKLTRINVATRTLVIKILQIALYVTAFLIGMDVVGINLTSLTVFSGALGIGIGFGLQQIASNFISGMILLAERSIKENDLIELQDGVQGFVRRTSARSTLVETFDGKEILIPNEEFITTRVTNWTLNTTRARIDIVVGVSYGSDLELTRSLMLSAASEHPRCMVDPKPACFLTEFADSSVNFKLMFWVEDVTAGRIEPQSDVMFAIWHKFKANGISIPFPQRDVHLIPAPAPAT